MPRFAFAETGWSDTNVGGRHGPEFVTKIDPFTLATSASGATSVGAPWVFSDDTKFAIYTSNWRRGTSHVSSFSRMESHPSFNALVAMGEASGRRVLEKMQRGEIYVQWFPLLHAIYKVDPVAVEDRGYINQMARSWLAWGKATKAI